MLTVDEIKERYPLHWLVWNNDHAELEKALSSEQYDIELYDNRGRTPLMLAVTLGYTESVEVLIEHEANVDAENKEGWNTLHEAIGTGKPELIKMLVARRSHQNYCKGAAGIPELLCKLEQAPDFYVEMKWEFTSWIPFVARNCPSDTYKVYKQGSNVRVDTTLVDYENSTWQRGNRSFIFKGKNDSATVMDIDHESKIVQTKQLHLYNEEKALNPSKKSILNYLTTPTLKVSIDTEKISFERNKAGIWGWRTDKSEAVNGYECKVFSANNVDIVMKTRSEHLSEEDKIKVKEEMDAIKAATGRFRNCKKTEKAAPSEEIVQDNSDITPEEYFDPDVDLNNRDIGRPKSINTKIHKFKAHLWLCEKYPLSLKEQIMPIIDLMAIMSSHFAKLKDFIQMQQPLGFPVKIEIPLFHVLTARITFGNIFGLDQEVPHVRCSQGSQLLCVLDGICFQPPPDYERHSITSVRTKRASKEVEEEDGLLEFAIQQSLIDAAENKRFAEQESPLIDGNENDEVDIWEALNAQRPSRPSTPIISAGEENLLRRAIQESLEFHQKQLREYNRENATEESEEACSSQTVDEQLSLALRLSEQQQIEEEQRQLLEEETFRRVLELSLTET